MKFKQVKLGRVSDSVLKQIKQGVLSGTYRTGDKPPSEKEWMGAFNVSRGSFKGSLEEIGFILVKPGPAGGAYVTSEGIVRLRRDFMTSC